jgi:hypothetical protein
MFPGIVGRLVELSKPHTEAAATAIAAQFIVLFGNATGHGPFVSVGETRHHLNENLLVVGPSATGRKGDGFQVAIAPFRIGDADWAKSRVKGGLASGEGLIHHVRDGQSGIKKDGTGGIVDEGVTDKRLMVIESEFANVLKVANRSGNTLSGVIRQAWDGNGVLSNLSKNSAEQATEAHISILGHTTPEDLCRYLSTTDAANGFGNRFLTLLTERVRSIPNPQSVPKDALGQLSQELGKLLERTRLVREMSRAPEAAHLWDDLYGELTSPPPGLLGALLARGAPHVTRLSAIYALLGGSTGLIEVEHVSSAAAFWDVVSTSITIVFGDRIGSREADRIREFMSPGDELTLTQLREEVFKGKISSAPLREACELLVRLSEFKFDKKKDTEGRPPEVLRRLTREEMLNKRRPRGDGVKQGDSKDFSGFSPFSDRVSS